eukprot:s2964_g5.t1
MEIICSTSAVALDVFRNMQHAGVEPNSVALCAALSALAAGRRWREALQILPTCPPEIIAVNATHYIEQRNMTANADATITACANASEWQAPLQLLSQLPESISPTVVTFSAAVSACERAGQWEQCLALLQELEKVGLLEEDSAAVNSSVKACAAAQQQRLAMLLLRRQSDPLRLRRPAGCADCGISPAHMATWVYNFGDGQEPWRAWLLSWADGRAEMKNLLGGKGGKGANLADSGQCHLNPGL